MSREYLYGDIGAHLIGYLGKLNPSPVKKKSRIQRCAPVEAFIGQWGADTFDRTLRGIPEKGFIEIDAFEER